MWDKLQAFKARLSDPSNSFLSKRNVIALLLLGIGVLSVPLGVDLVQTQTSLRSQAAGEGVYRTNTDRGIKTIAQMKSELTAAGYDSRGSQYSTYGKSLNDHTNADIFHAYLQAGRPNNTIECIVNVGDLNNMSPTEQPFVVGQPVIVSVMQKPGQPDNGCYYGEINVIDYTNSGDPTSGNRVCAASGFRGNDYSPDRVKDCHYSPTRIGVNKLSVYYGGHSGSSRMVDANGDGVAEEIGCSDEPKMATCEFVAVAGTGSSSSGGASFPIDSTPQSGARGSATCSNQTANLNWSGFTAPSGASITNYTLRVNKAPFREWTPNETCSETTATNADCMMQVGTVLSKNIKLSDGAYGFSIQPGFTKGTALSVGPQVNMSEFTCGATGSTAGQAPQPPTALRAVSVCDSSGSITLRWKRGEGATSYKVLVDGQEVQATVPSDPLVRPYAAFRTQRGQTYTWTVQSVNSSGTSSPVTGNQFSCNT